jgi:hypothetical protein
MNSDALRREYMVSDKKSREELFSYLDLPRIGKREPVADMVVMTVEFMKYQGEVAYETAKRQAIAITSMASTISIGWSVFFFGIYEGGWLAPSIGIMLVFAGTFFLGYWTPRFVEKLRMGLNELGTAKFYDKWLSGSAKSGDAGKSQ